MDNISTLILAFALIVTMWGMGLGLVMQDFRRILDNPKAVYLGLLNQLVLLPLIGFLLVSFIPSSPEIAVGIMILAACPGGPTSNLLSMLAKADTALSVSLTAITSLVTIFTIPFIVNFGLERFAGAGQNIQIDVLKTILTLLVIVIIPMSIGMLVRAKKTQFANKMAKPTRILSVILLALIIVGIVIKEKDNVVEFFARAGILALMLNAITMGFGYYSAKFMHLDRKQSLTISLESGVQNGTMALAIAGTLLANTAYGIAPAVYSLIMYFTSGIVITLFLRNKI